MRALALLLTLLSLQGQSPRAALRLKPGDIVTVTSDYGGDFTVMADGAIYGRGFGRIVLEGKTWEEAQLAVRRGLRTCVKEDEVNLVFKEVHRGLIYLAGIGGGKGAIELVPDLTLRQVLASAPLDENADLVEAQLFRAGKKVCAVNVAALLSGDAKTPDQPLEPDDVVSLTPASFVRVWVTGMVGKPGQIHIPAGSDPYQAIAEAGGISSPQAATDPALLDEARIILRRGPEEIELPLHPDLKAQQVHVESGDTLSVVAPEARRVTVGGQVQKPGEVVVRGTGSLVSAIALAGGATLDGTLSNVLVMRRGELYTIDASGPAGSRSLTPFTVEPGDLVYVQRNERAYLALGALTNPGRFLMKDGKTYRLSDALAEAGGLNSKGTLRRVALARADKSGKIQVTQFNLDEFFKNGREQANPEIHPGDCVLFGEPKGLTFANVTQALSGLILFETVTRSRP